MSLVNAPFGFQPTYHPSGQIRAVAHVGVLQPGTNVNIFSGQPVFLAIGTAATVNGVTIPAGQVYLAPVTTGSAAQKLAGIFAGCEYQDATGFYQESNFWPASQVVFPGTVVTAYIYQDQEIVYSVQLDGALLATTTLGDSLSRFDGRQTFVSNFAAGSTTTGLSQCTLSASGIVATGVQGQFALLKLDPTILNQSAGDAYPVYQVKLSNSEFATPFVSI